MKTAGASGGMREQAAAYICVNALVFTWTPGAWAGPLSGHNQLLPGASPYVSSPSLHALAWVCACCSPELAYSSGLGTSLCARVEGLGEGGLRTAGGRPTGVLFSDAYGPSQAGLSEFWTMCSFCPGPFEPPAHSLCICCHTGHPGWQATTGTHCTPLMKHGAWDLGVVGGLQGLGVSRGAPHLSWHPPWPLALLLDVQGQRWK